jgi:hypothetical protein
MRRDQADPVTARGGSRNRFRLVLIAASAAALGLLPVSAARRAEAAPTAPATPATTTAPPAPSAPSAERRSEPLEARFRGCEPAGWCRFWIESLDPLAQSLHRVRPNGIPDMPAGEPLAQAMSRRLDALLSNMIHQNKDIRLQGLRSRRDGAFTAVVTVNGEDVASDPIIRELRDRIGTAR